jgi:hypothetical protein
MNWKWIGGQGREIRLAERKPKVAAAYSNFGNLPEEIIYFEWREGKGRELFTAKFGSKPNIFYTF